jgi:hypothetical protein
MMISMRYGRNLAGGFGLVWNPDGERVEGYSNFGWLMLMAAVHWLPLPDTLTSLVMLLINLALSGLVLLLTALLARRLVPKPGLALLAALLTLVIIVDLARWTTIGLEVPLQTALFLWLVLRVLDEAESGRPRPSTFLFAGLLGLVRVDGPLLAGLLCLLAFALQADKRQIAAYSPFILALPLLHILFRLYYYGFPLPNTYYLKLAAWDERWLPGLRYLARFVQLYGPVWLVALAGVIRSGSRRGQWLWLLGLPLAAYALYTGGDDFGGARFFAPWLPVLILLAFLTPRWLGWPNRPLPAAAFLAALALLTGLLAGYRFYRGPGQEAYLAQAGIILEQITSPNTEIAVFWAGTLPYFAHRPAVDMLGKNDAVVARRPARPGSLKPGHNKFDYDYSFDEYRPDLIISPLALSIAADRPAFLVLTEGDDAYAGQLYLNQKFQEHYAPTLLYINNLPVFIDARSPEWERLLSRSSCEPLTSPQLQALGLETVCRWVD